MVAQLAFALRRTDRGLLQGLLRLARTLQALCQLLPDCLRSAQLRRQSCIALRRIELEVVGGCLAAHDHRLQRLLTPPLGIGIIGRHRKHCQETLGRGVQLLSLQCPLRLPQALVHRARQGFLAGRQIGMTGIELAGTTQDRGRLGQLSAPCQRARLQQQVAQRIFATFQRRQVVRLQGKDALEQGQRTAVAIIQASGRERVARLGQQRTNTGSGTASRLQLAGDRIGFALRHLQLTGQCQCLRAAVRSPACRRSRACCSAAAPVLARPWRACGRSPSSASTAW